MSYVIITHDDGSVQTHENVELNDINLPDTAETYDTENDYQERLAELTS